MMNGLGARYAMVAGPGLATTGVSFVLLVAPAGPLWLSLALLGFGLSLVTSATLRDLSDATTQATRPSLTERASKAQDARARRGQASGGSGEGARRRKPTLDRTG